MFTLKKQYPNSLILFFDIDNTIVLEKYPPEMAMETIVLNKGVQFKRYLPNRKIIKELIQHALRGDTIVLWSAAGADWCNTVAKKLNLNKYVAACLAKPDHFFDDLPSFVFLPEKNRIKPT